MLAPIAHAENCLTWLLCPLKSPTGYADTGRVTMADANLPSNTVWDQIIVRGSGAYDLGQALVCVISSSGTVAAIESAATASECTTVQRNAVNGLLQRPHASYLDTSEGRMRLRDGQGGRETRFLNLSIPNTITDELVQGIDVTRP